MIGKALPRCPTAWGWTNYISYPSVAFMFVIMTIVSFIFAAVIGFKYNSVRVFNRKIRTQNISNTMWILYYTALGFRGICNTLRYSLEQRHEESIDSIFFLASLILHGLTAFALSLALNHQRKYRSSLPPSSAQPAKKETDPLLAKYSWCRRTITGVETTFFLFFVIYLIFLYLQIMKSDNKVYEYLFLATFALQRIPVIVLVVLICSGRVNSGVQSGDGPTRRSRVYLGVAAILNIAGESSYVFCNKFRRSSINNLELHFHRRMCFCGGVMGGFNSSFVHCITPFLLLVPSLRVPSEHGRVYLDNCVSNSRYL
jgi:hypothetical protein